MECKCKCKCKRKRKRKRNQCYDHLRRLRLIFGGYSALITACARRDQSALTPSTSIHDWEHTQLASMSKRIRTRSGCLSCRARKKKCDGARPRCSNCHNRREACCYGLKASFHPSRELQLSIEDGAALLATEIERGNNRTLATSFVDDTSQIVREYETVCATALTSTATGEDSQYGLHASTGPLTRVVNGLTHHAVFEPLAPQNRATGDSMPSDVGTGNRISSPNHPHNSDEGDDPASLSIDVPVMKEAQIRLIHAFLQETGTWCEITDSKRHFTIKYIHSLMENKPFAAAAMALASLQQDAVCRKSQEVSLSLYQYAVQSLRHYEPSQCGEASLVCCVLLSIYEMVTWETSPSEWRRHLKVGLRLRVCELLPNADTYRAVSSIWRTRAGTAAAQLLSGQPSGPLRVLVRQEFFFRSMTDPKADIWASYLLKDKTLIAPESWTDGWSATYLRCSGALEDYCNLSTLVLANVANLLATGFPHVEEPGGASKANSLWLDLQGWYKHRPRELLPLMREGVTRGNPFPTTLLAGDSSIYAHTMYHAGCILLLRDGWLPSDPAEQSADVLDVIWHARELCGISMTTTSHAGWIHQVFPLHIAGVAFGAAETDDGEEYVREKFTLLKHLAKIERETGWPTRSKAADLRTQWGLE